MKLWLTSSEIAELALPGVPATRQNVVELAKREDWARFSALCRQRAGRGGGLEYHVTLLPVAARIAYFGAEAPAPAAGEAIQAAREPAAGTTSAATLQLDARLAVLGALKAFVRASGMKQTVAISYFVDLYNLGKIDVPSWAAQILSAAALFDFRAASGWVSVTAAELSALAAAVGEHLRACDALERQLWADIDLGTIDSKGDIDAAAWPATAVAA